MQLVAGVSNFKAFITFDFFVQLCGIFRRHSHESRLQYISPPIINVLSITK